MKKGRWKIALVCFSTGLALLLLVGAMLGQEKSSKEPYPQLAVLSEVLSRIQTDYVEDPNFSKVTAGALHGLLESLDPYSSYLTPEEYKAYERKHDTEASVGMVVSKRAGFVSVVTVLPSGPAASANLGGGDIIESIDGRTTREMSLAEVNYRLQGTPGTEVKLSMVRQGTSDPKEFDLKRAAVPVPDATSIMMDAGVGYVRVQAFPKGETQKIAARIQELRKNGAKKFVLDLRDDAYGETEEGISTANLFLSKGLISYLSGQQFPRKSFLADASKSIATEPLVVLVNVSTGGAAEIVAGAVLDNHRGEVVGERTFGIGAVQKLIPMDDGSALILSIAKYYTPSGKAIQDTGVIPSVPIEEDRDSASGPGDESAPPDRSKKPAVDAPLKRALELLAQENKPTAA